MEADELANLLREWADDNAQHTGAAFDENAFFIHDNDETFAVIVVKVVG